MLLQVSADAALIRQDQLRAARPQAILKPRPPNSLDYRVRYEPQSHFQIYYMNMKELQIAPFHIAC